MNKTKQSSQQHSIILVSLLLLIISTSCIFGSLLDNLINPLAADTSNPVRIKSTQPRISPTPSPTPSDLELFMHLQPEISQAIYLQQVEGNCVDAIPLWNKVLDQLPDYAKGYYYRGSCFYLLGSTSQLFEVISSDFYSLGYADAIKGLQIGPESGHYYDLKFALEGRLGVLEDFRIDRLEWYSTAIGSHLRAIDLGLRDIGGNRGIGFELIENLRCDEALAYFQELESIMDPDFLPSAGIHTGYAESYLCLKDYDQALDHINLALELYPTPEREFTKALIDLNSGNLHEALELLNKSIDEKPEHHGRRYYLRALIHYELGNPELALPDLARGQRNTWGDYLERSYVLGRIALDKGNDLEGIDHVKLAEASLFIHEVPRIYDQTVSLLEDYHTEPLYPTPTPDNQPTLTPISPYSDQAYFTPTPATDHSRFTLANYSGTGMIYFEDYARIGISFRPNQRVEIEEVYSIIVHVDPGPRSQEDLGLSVECVSLDGIWNTPQHPMEFEDLHSGPNIIADITHCVDSTGFMNLLFWNISGSPISLKNIGIEIDAVRPN